MQIVNGYICQTGCDVAAARAGHDPKNPHDDPVKARQLEEQKALASGKPIEGGNAAAPPETSGAGTISAFAIEAVTFGGQLAGLTAARGSAPSALQLVDRVA
jgi:hypothetical protein